jgi:hypothetical protein
VLTDCDPAGYQMAASIGRKLQALRDLRFVVLPVALTVEQVLELRLPSTLLKETHESVIADAIDAAEDIHDPLDGLAEKTVADPGAPFVPEALERLTALKKEDRAAFEALRAQLKRWGAG